VFNHAAFERYPSATWAERGRAIVIYAATGGCCNLTWEMAQLPLYTVWRQGTVREIAFDVAHCSVGDVMIATVALTGALLLCRARSWPHGSWRVVVITACVLGFLYTAYSEWLNVYVRKSWAYSELMPLIGFGSIQLGIAPLLQWVVVPLPVLALTRIFLQRAGNRR